jgi:hypothetical protein
MTNKHTVWVRQFLLRRVYLINNEVRSQKSEVRMKTL